LKEEKGLVMDTARSKATQKNHISEASSKNSIMPEGAAQLVKISWSSATSSAAPGRVRGKEDGGGDHRKCGIGSFDTNFC
jgi:hypothetical protein